METSNSAITPTRRLTIGNAILAATQVVDTKSIRTRVQAFAGAHSNYVEAQRKVDEAKLHMEIAQRRVVQLDADQDEALERLACSLVNEGEPRTNPFSRFAADGPGRIKNMAWAEEVKAIRDVVASIQRNKNWSQATMDLAQLVEQAALKVEVELGPLQGLQTNLQEARKKRDVIARAWDRTLAALRAAARLAAIDGVPSLHDDLFVGSRPVKKTKTAKAAKVAAATSSPDATESVAPVAALAAGES